MDQPIRVLHLVDSLNLGGVQTLLLSVLPRLADHGVACELAALHGPGPFSETFTRRGFPPLHLARTRCDPRICGRLFRALRANPPDLLHAHGAPSCLFAEWMRKFGAVPRLVEHLHHIRGGGRVTQRLIERRIYHNADVILACSQAAADSVATHVPMRVIHNGIDTSVFRPPDALERAAARGRFGYGEEDFVIGMVGRLTHNKGQQQVCEALLALRDAYPRLRLLLAGSGPQAAALENWCARNGMGNRVLLTGFQADVLPVLHALDAFVMASAEEGLGISLLEAMATGLPCLVSDFPSARAIVTPGENALSFARGHTGSLIQAIGDCVESPHKRLDWGAHARTTIAKRFTLDHTVAQFAAAYRALC